MRRNNMETFFFQLTRIAREQGISDAQLGLWRSFVLAAGDKALAPMCAVLAERPELIRFFTENIEKKVHALKMRDAGAWDALVKEEKDFLEREDAV